MEKTNELKEKLKQLFLKSCEDKTIRKVLSKQNILRTDLVEKKILNSIKFEDKENLFLYSDETSLGEAWIINFENLPPIQLGCVYKYWCKDYWWFTKKETEKYIKELSGNKFWKSFHFENGNCFKFSDVKYLLIHGSLFAEISEDVYKILEKAYKKSATESDLYILNKRLDNNKEIL